MTIAAFFVSSEGGDDDDTRVYVIVFDSLLGVFSR